MVRRVISLSRRLPGPRSASLRGLTKTRRHREAGHRSGVALEVVFGESRCYLDSSLGLFVRSEVVTDSSVAVVDAVDVKQPGSEDSEGPAAEGNFEQESEVLVVDCLLSVISRGVWWVVASWAHLAC